MRNFTAIVLILALCFVITACASGPNLPPNARGAIEAARPGARLVAEEALHIRFGVPLEVSAAGFALIDPMITNLLDGKQFALMSDVGAWQTLRPSVVAQAADKLAPQLKNYPLVDRATIEFTVGTLLDTLAAIAQSQTKAPQPVASPAPLPPPAVTGTEGAVRV